MSDFVYLNIHTHFSRDGGPASPEDWCRYASQLGYKQLGIADRAPMAGFPTFADAARRYGLSPVYGVELDVTLPQAGVSSIQTVILYAADKDGLTNLARLSEKAYAGWPQREQPVAWDMLVTHSAGLVLVLMPGGFPTSNIVNDIKAHFGERAFVGLTHASSPLAEEAVKAAKSLDLPLVAMPPARYLHEDDARSYEALKAAREKAGWVASRNEEQAAALPQSLRSPSEVETLFKEWPAALENASGIAEMCKGANFGHHVLASGSGHPKPRIIDVAAGKQRESLEELAGERAIAFVTHALEVTPKVALQAAGSVLGTSDEQLSELITATLEQGWDALAAEGGEAASLACSLRGALLLFKPDANTLVFLPQTAEGNAPSLPLLSAEGSSWIPLTQETLCRLGYETVSLRPSYALSVLDKAVQLAADYPSSEFEAPSDLSQFPVFSDSAMAVLKKGEIEGIPYLSDKALKAWKGDFSPESVAVLVALSAQGGAKTQAPEGDIAGWTEQTSSTGGALLYFEQFDSIVEAIGIPSQETASLRLAMLDTETSTSDALRERFILGCTSSGLETGVVDSLWDALKASAPHLMPRETASAWARTALWTIELKAGHPAAFLSASLDMAWEREGRALIQPLTEEARRLDIKIIAPDIGRSQASAIPVQNGSQWSVLWGLAFLPGWDHPTAERFINARSRANECATLRDLVKAGVEAELSQEQFEALVRAGACDRLGGREALLAVLPSAIEWVRSSQGEEPPESVAPDASLSPRQRLALRDWEEQNLGLRFTNAAEMDGLRKAINDSGNLRSRLITTDRISAAQMGQSIYLVGLLTDIRLIDDPQGKAGSDEHAATAWVEDLEGAIELVAFPPNYKRHTNLWTENNIAIITARVASHSDDGDLYLLCEHLAAYDVGIDEEEINVTVAAPSKRPTATVPLPTPEAHASNGGSRVVPGLKSQVSSQTNQSRTGNLTIGTWDLGLETTGEPPSYHLIITLPSSDDDHADIDRMINLNNLLKAYAGPDIVTLRIPYNPETSDYTIAKLPRGVRYDSDLEGEIRELLGPEALALIKLGG